MSAGSDARTQVQTIEIAAANVRLVGDLTIPVAAKGLVVFAHGSGSSRTSPRNRAVARVLHETGLGTLLLDLLTPDEDVREQQGGTLRFDVAQLATRLGAAVDWLSRASATRDLPLGLFGASTGAAAAIVAAAARPALVHAVVSRGGRPDLTGGALETLAVPALLIVGGNDEAVIELNQRAMDRLHGTKRLVVIPSATHLFEERGALAEVARLAADWFLSHLTGALRKTQGLERARTDLEC